MGHATPRFGRGGVREPTDAFECATLYTPADRTSSHVAEPVALTFEPVALTFEPVALTFGRCGTFTKSLDPMPNEIARRKPRVEREVRPAGFHRESPWRSSAPTRSPKCASVIDPGGGIVFTGHEQYRHSRSWQRVNGEASQMRVIPHGRERPLRVECGKGDCEAPRR